jgi:hypothetical protein
LPEAGERLLGEMGAASGLDMAVLPQFMLVYNVADAGRLIMQVDKYPRKQSLKLLTAMERDWEKRQDG